MRRVLDSGRGGPCGRPGWCGLCYSNRRGRSNYRGHWGYRSPRVLFAREVVVPIKSPDAEGAMVVSQGVRECQLLLRCPTVWEYLTESTYDDGKHRETSTLTLFVEGSYLKLALNDRQNRRGLYLAGEAIEGLLEATEAILASGNVPWKNWPTRKAGK